MDSPHTNKNTDDSLGVVFKGPHGQENRGVNMEKALASKKVHASKSILSSSEDVFDIGHAFKGSGEVEKGTIVTDKRHVHVGIGETLKGAFTEWYTKTSSSLKNVQVLQKKEPVTVASPETRKEVIKEAASFTKHVPKDDHTIIVEKLKTLNQDATRITGRPFLLKKTEEDNAHQTQESTPGAVPTPRPPTYQNSHRQIDRERGKKTLDLRSTAIAPRVEKKFSDGIPNTPPPPRSADSSLPLIRTLPKEGRVAPERKIEAPTKRVIGSIPENLPGVVHADTTASGKTVAEKSWSFLLKEVAEETPKPINVSFPEWDVESRISEVLSNPAPDPEELARIERERREEEARKQEDIERLRREEEEENAIIQAEEERIMREEMEAEATRQAEAARLKLAQSNVMKSLRRERERALPEEEAEPAPNMWFVLLRVVVEKLADMPRRTIFITIAVLVGIVAGVTLAFVVAQNSSKEAVSTVVPLVSSDTQIEAALGTTRSVFVGSLIRAINEAPQGITHILVREESGAALTPQVFFSSLGATVQGSFVRALDNDMMIGSVSLSENEPFILFHTNAFDSAFAGMLEWEPRMQKDFAPLFGEPEEASGKITDTKIGSRTSFVDATAGSNAIRILRNEAGEEVMLYAFVNRSTLIITSSTEALTAVLLRMR